MATSVAGSTPLWCDGISWTAALARTVEYAVAVFDQGTHTAVAPGGGVFQAPYAALAVSAPVSGLSVNISAGYCAVPATTAGQGVYLFGLMASGALTVASNGSGNPRIDLVVAQVHDLGSSSSFCDINIITGTPSSSPATPAVPTNAIALAKVAVANAAANIVAGNITDLRAFAVPPGGVLPIVSAATAPAVPATQFMFNEATGLLVQGTGTAGSVATAGFVAGGVQDMVNTSTGATGDTPGNGSRPWGIGYGGVDQFFFFGFGFGVSTDGISAEQMQVQFEADGSSDYEVFFKWGQVITAEQGAGIGTSISNGQVALQVLLDGRLVDTVFLAATSNGHSGSGGSASWFTDGPSGTTPTAGPHTVSLAVLTTSTFVSSTHVVSGVFIGDLAASAVGVFGASSGYAAALTAENCLLRVLQVPPS